MKKIYLDHAATTYVKKEVYDKMTPYFLENFGNPSSLHSFGRASMSGVDEAREKIAKAIGASSSEIYFTSGGSEADNWAIRGIAKRRGKGHIITSAIEHPAVIETCKDLEKQGFTVSYIGVDEFGFVNLEEIEHAITDDTILISIMAANNEVGTIQPIEKIASIAKAKKIPFHSDAVQAIGALDIDVKKMGVDLLSMSAHKFYGPKGIGALYIRNGLATARFLTGGEQERGMRAGTTPAPLIVGMGEAIELAYKDIDEKRAKLSSLRDYLIERVLAEVPFSRLNGDSSLRLVNNANISFEFIEGESILMLLDLAGIAVSTGSACSSGSLKSSHVLMAMGVDEEIAHSSVRFTLGDENTKEEIDYTIEKLKEAVSKLRIMSPLFNEFKGGEKHV